MRFNPKANLDQSRVRSTKRGGGGMGGLPIPGGRAGGGSLIGIIVVVGFYIVANLAGVSVPGVPGLGTGAGYSPTRVDDAEDSARYDHCQTGADANEDHDCARVAVENSLTDFWESQIDGFEPIRALTTFSGTAATGCGTADAAVGPFYCPSDRGIYLDTTFFDTVLERQLGGPDGGFVEFYVLAHEYGHHVSNLLGSMDRARSSETGPQSPATRLELQADCYAGMWAGHATTTEDGAGRVLIADLTREDVELALEAAAAVGDDHIQRTTQGQTNPETWNHGSSAQRQHWFTVGFEQGDIAACDTFAAAQV